MWLVGVLGQLGLHNKSGSSKQTHIKKNPLPDPRPRKFTPIFLLRVLALLPSFNFFSFVFFRTEDWPQGLRCAGKHPSTESSSGFNSLLSSEIQCKVHTQLESFAFGHLVPVSLMQKSVLPLNSLGRLGKIWLIGKRGVTGTGTQ